jgi:hypothetical protein
MPMFLLPKTVIRRMDKLRRKFFWQGGSLKKKYHLVKWSRIHKAKKKGGMGVNNKERGHGS